MPSDICVSKSNENYMITIIMTILIKVAKLAKT